MIQNDKVVTLHYSLKEGGPQGELIEDTFQAEPLVYLHGHGTMIVGFEKNLEGKSIGDTYSFLLSPEEAYGSIKSENIIEVPKDNFIDESGQLDTQSLEPGAPINMSDEEGNFFQGFIAEVKSQSVVVDFNHPLAGISLYFSGEIIDIRDASQEELDHGHVHGVGGHHH